MAQHRPPITPEKVLELFRGAWPNREPYPDSNACYSVAMKMNAVLLKGVKPPKRQLLLGSAEATKHGRLFLKHLTAARERLRPLDFRQVPDPDPERAGSYIDALPNVWRQIIEQIDKMEAVERDVRALLDAPHPIPDRRNAARFIGDAAIEAWRQAGEKVSRSPTGPLCAFVTQALAAIGHNYAESYVSDMLRNRHNRPRSGKPRS